MKNVNVDQDIRLIPYYRNDEVSLAWYQDPDICKQVDNIDHVYDLEQLHRMYDYICANGDCYYIEYQGKLVGDVSLQENGEVAIVVAKDYQNLHIGRRCIREMLRLAAGKGMESVKARIYEFNEQSRHMFLTAGFKQISEEWFECACDESVLIVTI